MSVCVCSNCQRHSVPPSIMQGERAEWTQSVCDHPATLWTLQYRFRSNVGPGVDVTATADGTAHDAVITAAQSILFGIGQYQWQAWVTEIATATNTFPVASGTIAVEQGFIAGSTGDVETRSAAQIALDTIDSALLAFATSDVMEYEISTPAGSRRVKRSDKTELMNMRKHYATTVSLERTKKRIESGGSFMRSVGIVVRES